MVPAEPRGVVVVIDGLPVERLEQELPNLPFLANRTRDGEAMVLLGEREVSHGALHRAHTVVPVLSSAALPARPLRTLDVFGEMLELAGIEPAEYRASDTVRIADGAWSPGVLR